MSPGAGHGGSCRGWLWGAGGSRVTQKIIFHPRCPPSAPLLCAGSLGQGNELFVPCSAGLFAFPLRAFCLCCSSSGRLATAASLEIAPAKPLLQKKNLSFVHGGSFQPSYASGNDGSCNQSPLGHARATKTNVLLCPEGSGSRLGQPRGRCRRSLRGAHSELCRGLRWVEARGWKRNGEDGSWKPCPRWCRAPPSPPLLWHMCGGKGLWAGGRELWSSHLS